MAAAVPYPLRTFAIVFTRRPARVATGLSLTAVLVFLAVTYGALPVLNAPTLDSQTGFQGVAKCAAESGNIFSASCERLGYPVGFRPIVGYPVQVILAFLHKYLSVPLVDAIQIFTLISLGLGVSGLFLLVRRFTQSTVAAVVAPFIFYSSPFVLGMSGFGSTYYGFILFPFYVAASLYLFGHIRAAFADPSLPRLLAAAVAQVVLLTFAALMDGYSFVMAIVTIGIFYTGLLIWHSGWMRPGRRLSLFFLYGGLLVFPGILYDLLLFPSTSEFASPMDFIRAQGIDVATMFIPTHRWLFADLTGIGPTGWSNYAFYGDGHNANLNFLGILTGASAAVGAIALLRRSSGSKVIAGLCIAIFVVGLVFALGPSLKIYDVREGEPLTQIAYEDHLMSADEATLTLPTAPVFGLPVISTMRATYRWQLIYRFAMVISMGFLLARLVDKKWLLAGLVALLLFENIPTAAIQGQDRYTLNRTQLEQFNSQVVDRLRPHVEESDRLLFLPAQNDFLVALIVPFTGGYTYNVMFDKELARILPQQPTGIVEARRKFDHGSFTAQDLRVLLDSGLVDKVVFTYFNLRWDSYWWPPPGKTVDSYRERVEELGLADASGLRAFGAEFFMVVENEPRQWLPASGERAR